MNNRSINLTRSQSPNRYQRNRKRKQVLNGVEGQHQGTHNSSLLVHALCAVGGAAAGYMTGMAAPRYSLWGGIVSAGTGLFLPNEGVRTFMTSFGLSLTGTSFSTRTENFKDNFKEAVEMAKVKAKFELPKDCCPCATTPVTDKSEVPTQQATTDDQNNNSNNGSTSDNTTVPTELTGLGKVKYFQYPASLQKKTLGETVQKPNLEDTLMIGLDAVAGELEKNAHRYIAMSQQWQQQQTATQQVAGVETELEEEMEHY